MNFLQKSVPFAAIFIFTLLSACQKHENNQKTEAVKTSTSEIDATEASRPKGPAQDCSQIDSSIQKLEKTVVAEDLYDLNQWFRNCLSTVPLKTRYQWQAKSEDIYQKLVMDASPQVFQYLTDSFAEGQSMT
ncbi:hypothetical protein HUN33_19785, partial [Acinetobacter bereziniae]|nr:hypothetical protein [Acinetobacter bereziniae]